MSDELATYSIEFRIDGMRVPDMPEGVGDRYLKFEIKIDPTDLEHATKAWYAHLEAMLGPDEMQQIQQSALDWVSERRRR